MYIIFVKTTNCFKIKFKKKISYVIKNKKLMPGLNTVLKYLSIKLIIKIILEKKVKRNILRNNKFKNMYILSILKVFFQLKTEIISV